ncbi:MAG TPA: SGNH/GDSL hydrolase family protein, partial [Gemmatimonadaceae bacterium]|nr:SGNH/GDSL hydrolase family protein [Gemmatimonadaceae bacterium]
LLPGDHRSATTMASAIRTDHWYVLAGIDVVRPDGAAVVVLGNSIADGRGSGTNKQNRWPDNLSRRLQADARTRNVAVLNQGMGGNCVLRFCIGPAALERLDRDVLAQRGARWLVVSIGVNDIGGATSPQAATRVVQDLVAAYEQIVTRARARGLRVYGATILPFGGSSYDSPDREAARQAVNARIRGGLFDAVIDLDAAMRDPAQPARLRPDVDGGDHLHPNEHGYRVMADAIDPTLFTR